MDFIKMFAISFFNFTFESVWTYNSDYIVLLKYENDTRKYTLLFRCQ